MTDFDEIDPAMVESELHEIRCAPERPDRGSSVPPSRSAWAKRHRAGGHRADAGAPQAGVLIVDVEAACSGSSRSGTSSPAWRDRDATRSRPRWAPS